MNVLKIVFTVLLLFASLSARTPEWVSNRPTSSSSYIGIAVVTKSEYPTKEEWIKAAELQALNNISSAISVTIQGAVTDTYIASDTASSSLYQAEVTALTKANLEGYEFVESHETRKEYWVYYTLQKSTWASIEQKRLREAETSAEAYLANADALRQQGKVVSAIRAYSQAFGEIVPVLYLDPKTDRSGSTIPLAAHIDERMVSLLNELKVDFPSPLYHGTRSSYGDSPAQVALKKGMSPVGSYPLVIGDEQRFTSADGSVVVSNSMVKNEDGAAEYLLHIKTDIESLIPAEIGSGLVRQWLSQMNWPSATAQMVFEKPSIYVEALEVGYNDLPYEQLELAVKEQLGNIGYAIARFPEEAEFRVMIKSTVRPAGSMGNLYFSFLDMSWTLFDKVGDQRMSESVDPVKGGALSYDDANIKAFLKGKDILAENIIGWIQENK